MVASGAAKKKKLNKEEEFGILPLGKLLRQQSIPAAVGFLVMSIYGIIDTIFVGRYVGANGIGAITVVMPISFLIASVGMAIGVGGASVISRAFGEQKPQKAIRTFSTMVSLTLGLSIVMTLVGFLFKNEILSLFGGKGEVYPFAETYFTILLYGIPALAWSMMSNNVIRAEGYPKMAMITLIVPAILNMILDPILIVWFDMGMAGAAWATTIGYIGSGLYTIGYFLYGKTKMRPGFKKLIPELELTKEIGSIGGVTLARQGAISLLAIVLNNALFAFGGELSLGVYGIINRLMFFIIFPVIGITQGFLPIAGYNYGAKIKERVDGILSLAIRSASVIAFGIFAVVMIFSKQITSIFTNDPELIAASVPAMRKVFLGTPLLAVNLIGSAYFQAIGKARPALLLALLRQAFLLVPLLFILPKFYGLNGIWYSFPIAEITALLITFFYLRFERKKNIY